MAVAEALADSDGEARETEDDGEREADFDGLAEAATVLGVIDVDAQSMPDTVTAPSPLLHEKELHATPKAEFT